MINFPCEICDHDKIMHKRNSAGTISCFVCVEYYNADFDNFRNYGHEYKASNLKYLERLYEKKVQNG